MALTYDQINAITQNKFIPKLVDNIFDSIVLLKRLRKSQSMLSGGVKVIVPLNYAKNSAAGSYQGADTLDTADSEGISAAEFSWKQYYSHIGITRRDELTNMGDSQVINFVKSKVEIAEKSLADALGDGVWSDASNSKDLVGVRSFLSTSNTYGGIDQSANSWWQASSVDSSTTTLTLSVMNSVHGASKVGSDKPTVGVCTQAIWDTYWSLLQPQERYTDSDTAKGGFQNLMFSGIPIVEDAKCPTSHLVFLNEKYIKLYPHKDENFRFEKFIKPVDQNIKSGKVYFMGVLASSNNRMHSGFTALTS